MCLLAYHDVGSHFTWGVTRVTPRRFYKQISILRALGKKFVTIQEYLALAPHERHDAFAITFDDGYMGVFENAYPVLAAWDIKASVFINPRYVGQFNTWDATFGKRNRHMGWSQLRILHQAGWDIGSHGFSHQDMTKLSAHRLERELLLSKMLISARIGSCCPVISFPFGNYDKHVWETCKEFSFSAGLAMGKKASDFENIFVRKGVYLFDSALLFRLKIVKSKSCSFTGMQRFFDACSNLTVAVRKKSWQIDKN